MYRICAISLCLTLALAGCSAPGESGSSTPTTGSHGKASLKLYVFDCGRLRFDSTSRVWHRWTLEGDQVTVTVNFLPGREFSEVEKQLIELTTRQPRTHLRNVLSEFLPRKLGGAPSGAFLRLAFLRPELMFCESGAVPVVGLPCVRSGVPRPFSH